MRAGEEQSDKQESLETAVVDAVADEKCRMVYDQVAEEQADGSAAISDLERRPKKTDSAAAPSWLWVSESACVLSFKQRG